DERVEQPEVKAALRENTEGAIAKGIFGVPTFVADGNVFWGADATGMLTDYLDDPGMFDSGEFARVSELPQAASRKPAVTAGD
ncbi:MAG: 2-hydroxychromene-2-carboxylate isomerase, partial [Gammaproteobacteria bacterium]